MQRNASSDLLGAGRPHSASRPPSRRAATCTAIATSLFLSFGWCVALPVNVARAQDAAADGGERNVAARALFDAGTIAFRQGRFEDALNNFEQAYRLTGDPVLLFNVATSLDRLRRDAEAVAQFQAYLDAMPDAPNRQAVQSRIDLLSRDLDKATEETPPATEEPASEPVAEPEPEPEPETNSAAVEVDSKDGGGLPPWVFYGGVGVTAVVGGVALWSGLDTLSAAGDYEDNPTRAGYDDGQDLELRTNVLMIAAGGTAILTVLAAVFTDWDGKESRDGSAQAAGPRFHVGMAAGPGAAGASLRGSF